MRARFNQDTVDLFTQGDCGALAARIHELTGWPVCGVRVGVGAGVDPALVHTRTWTHVMVRTPEGLYLDVTGARTAPDTKKHWMGEQVERPTGTRHDEVLVEIRDVWLSPFDEYTPQERRARACAVARRVLTLYSQRPEVQDFVPVSWWTSNPEFIGL